jgi:hypothetical protein
VSVGIDVLDSLHPGGRVQKMFLIIIHMASDVGKRES